MKRFLAAAASLVFLGCSRPAPDVDHHREGTPDWGVPYGGEFWSMPEGGGIDVGGVIDRVTHAFDDGSPSRPAVEARRYRAELAGDSMRFSVAGEAARIRTASVRRGERELVEEASAWAVTGNTAQIRLRPDDSLLAHHQAKASGVEVVWVLRHEPGGTGDLVIELDVDGGSYESTGSAGHRFSLGSADIRVGHAVAVDSSGKRWEVTSRAYGDTVRYEVEASVLASARYPLAIDPLVSAELPVDPDQHLPPLADQQGPAVAFGSGVWLVAWHTETASGSNAFRVRAARVSPSGSVLDPTGIPVTNDASGSAFGIDVGYDGNHFFVFWAERSALFHIDIVGQRISPVDGATLDGEFGKDVITASGNQTYPSAVFDGTNFFLVFHDTRNDTTAPFTADIYGARVRPSDLAVLGEVAISAIPEFNEFFPTAAFDGTNYVVSWHDARNAGTGADVHAARVRASDLALLDASPAAIGQHSGDQTNVRLSFDGTNFLAVWADTRAGNSDIYGARFTPGLVVLDTAHIPIAVSGSNEVEPDVRFDGTNHVVVYTDGAAIRATRVSPTGGQILDPPAKTLVATGGAQPRLAANGTALFAAWRDSRSFGTSEYDVYASRFSSPDLLPLDAGGIPLGAGDEGHAPAVASLGTNFLVVWQHEHAQSGLDRAEIIGARVLEQDGTILDTIPLVVDSGSFSKRNPRIAAGSSTYLVIWQDNDGTERVLGRRLTAAGTPISPPSVIVDLASNAVDVQTAVASDGTNFFVVWRYWTGFTDSEHIHAVRIRESDGVILDSPPTVLASVNPGFSLRTPAVAAGPGEFFTVWERGIDGGGTDVFGVRVSSTSGDLVDASPLLLSPMAGSQSAPAIAFDGPNYLVVWKDDAIARVGGTRVRASDAQILDPSGLAFGNRAVPPEVSARASEFLVTWASDHLGSMDVFAARVLGADGAVPDAPDGFAVSAGSLVDESQPAIASGNTKSLIAYTRTVAAEGERVVRARLVENEPVIALDDVAATNEDVALNVTAPGVLANDVGSALQAVLVTNPASGTLVLGLDGSFTYTPAANFNGTDSFTYRAQSGSTLSAPATVTITVNPVNDAPVAVQDAFMTDEDVMLAVAAPGVLTNDSDVDGDTLRAILVSDVSNGTLSLSTNGAFTYVPGADFNGTDSFTYHAHDGALSSATAAVTITVNAINDAPVLTPPGAQTVDEDQVLVLPAIVVTDVDIGGGALAVTLAAGQGTLTLAATGGLSFTAGDGTADPSMAFSGMLGAVQTALNGVAYAPAPDFNGSDSIGITVDDQGATGAGGALSDDGSIAVTVNPVNDAPVNVVPGAQTVNEDTDLALALATSDVDPGDLRVILSVQNGVLSLAATDALVFATGDGVADPQLDFSGSPASIAAAIDGVVYRGTLDFFGEDVLTFTTDDLANGGPGALTDTETVAITVLPVNDPPTAPVPLSPADGDVVEERSPVLTVTNGTDVDDATLTYRFEVVDAGGTIVASASDVSEGAETTSWTVDPPLPRGAGYSWTATAVDASGATAESVVSGFEVEEARSGGGGGCGCSLAGGTRPGGSLLAALAALGLMAFRRRDGGTGS